MFLLLLLVPAALSENEIRDTVTISGADRTGGSTTDPLESLAFVRQPEDRVVEQNEGVTQYCIVNNVQGADYHYRWYKFRDFERSVQLNDANLISGVDDQELYISQVQPYNDGYYLCTVTVASTNFTIISNSARLTVTFFEAPSSPIARKNSFVQQNQDYVDLKCDVPAASPRPLVAWYKGDEKILDDPRMFILPEDTMVRQSYLKRGSLIIMYVEREDIGFYHCKTVHSGQEYLLTSYALRVDGVVQTSPIIDAQFFSEVSGSSRLGGRAEFYCAGIGKPAPYVSWQNEDGSRIETSEKYQLQDNRRRLVITNVNNDDAHSYTCSLSVRTERVTRQDRKTIFYLTITASTDANIEFVKVPESHVVHTNRYPGFTLRCAIDYTPFISIDSSLKPVLYWLKDGKQLAISKRMQRRTKENSDSKTLESTIDFDTPNEGDLDPSLEDTMHFIYPTESDKGIYQCIAKSSTQLRQVTAHVNVRREEGDYVVTEGDATYDIVKTPTTVDRAEEHCRLWRSSGHLVSIMSKLEAQTVTRLLKAEGIWQSWIGLTSERSPGVWEWTQPADNSIVFSYWHTDSPDNLYGGEYYAIMDTEVEGKWRDVRNRGGEYPFVCKQYQTTCPSVREYYEGKLEPLDRVESRDTRYGVGESITVTCTDRTVPLKETLKCVTSGKYEPDEGFTCPLYSAAPSSTLPSFSLILCLIILNIVAR